MILDIFFGCVFLVVFQETHFTHFQLPYVSYLVQAAESFFFPHSELDSTMVIQMYLIDCFI